MKHKKKKKKKKKKKQHQQHQKKKKMMAIKVKKKLERGRWNQPNKKRKFSNQVIKEAQNKNEKIKKQFQKRNEINHRVRWADYQPITKRNGPVLSVEGEEEEGGVCVWGVGNEALTDAWFIWSDQLR